MNANERECGEDGPVLDRGPGFGLRERRFIVEDPDAGYRQVRPLVRNKKDGSVLVLVPAGEFEMGDGKDAGCPKHRVWVDAYWIGVCCVTNAQYARFVKETRRVEGGKWKVDRGKEDHPVVNVSWDDAMAYAAWAGCALPTEAQWEKAARGPTGLVYPWGNDWDEKKCRNTGNKGGGQTCAVWEYGAGASGYGTLNQSGNVWEWCRDWYGEKYYSEAGAAMNPEGPSTGSGRVDRDGSWSSAVASSFRGVCRDWYDPADRNVILGFRLVLALRSS